MTVASNVMTAQPVVDDSAAVRTDVANAAIEAKDVNIYYGNFHAVRDVNLKIERRKITAMIGPSGCGKSTVLRSFNRMNDLISTARVDGSIEFNGQNIYAKEVDPVEVRRRIGMVFRSPIRFLNPFMRILPGVPRSMVLKAIWMSS